MDEVWLVSLCFTFLAFVVVLLSLKKADDEGESAAKAQERSAAPVFASAQPAARFMEMTLEDIEKSLQRLGAVLGTEPEKQQQHPAQHEERKEQSGGEVRSAPVSQARAVAFETLPVPKFELVNQHFATEDWEFEDEEEIDALQSEGAEKQYYHLYWDEESLHNRSSYSVIEKAGLTRRKKMCNMNTREREMTCPKFLQLGSNPLYLQHSGKQHTVDQLVRLQRGGQIDNDKLKSCTTYQNDSTPQLTTTELSKSLRPASGSKVNKIDTKFNLSPCTDKPISLESEKQVSSWTGRDIDDYGRYCCEEFSLLNYKLQTNDGDSDSETSSMNSCLPPSPRLRKWSPIPLSHCMDGEDSSSIDDISSSPTTSRESRFTSCDESSSSDISLISFLSDSSLSESSSKNADSRDPRYSTLVARMRTGLVKAVSKADKTPVLVANSSVAKLNASKEVALSDIQNNFTETDRKDYFLGGRKSNIHACSVHLEESSTSLCILQPVTFYSGEPNTTGMLLNVENAGYQISSEYSGEPVKWRLEKQNGRKHVKDDISAIHKFPCCENVHNQQEGTLWEIRPGQELWPDFNQVKIRPSEQPDPWRHGGGEGIETLEHPPVTSSTRTIMEQIEQAVQETPDHNKERSEYVRVRRAPPAPRFETPPRDDVPESRSMHSSD